jgi:hypothetical protein
MKQRIFSYFQDYLIQYISHQYQDLLYHDIIIVLLQNYCPTFILGYCFSPRNKIWIYWSESNPWIYFYIILKKTDNFTGLNTVLLVWTKFGWFWAGGPVLVVRTVVLVCCCAFCLVRFAILYLSNYYYIMESNDRKTIVWKKNDRKTIVCNKMTGEIYYEIKWPKKYVWNKMTGELYYELLCFL